MIGGALGFAATEATGLAAAIWPQAWLNLFGDDPTMIATGQAYLRAVGPTYEFSGFWLALISPRRQAHVAAFSRDSRAS
jgi:hypothetical protein